MKVKYIDKSSDEHRQMTVKWGSNDDPGEFLEVDGIYEVDNVEVHSYHTKLYLKEFPNKKFNSAHFIGVDCNLEDVIDQNS
jgi:hypothetical protein